MVIRIEYAGTTPCIEKKKFGVKYLYSDNADYISIKTLREIAQVLKLISDEGYSARLLGKV